MNGSLPNIKPHFFFQRTFSYDIVPNTPHCPRFYICRISTIDHLWVKIIQFYECKLFYSEIMIIWGMKYHTLLDHMTFLSNLWNRKLNSSKIQKLRFYKEMKRISVDTKITKKWREKQELCFFYRFWQNNSGFGHWINNKIVIEKKSTFVVPGSIWVRKW